MAGAPKNRFAAETGQTKQPSTRQQPENTTIQVEKSIDLKSKRCILVFHTLRIVIVILVVVISIVVATRSDFAPFGVIHVHFSLPSNTLTMFSFSYYQYSLRIKYNNAYEMKLLFYSLLFHNIVTIVLILTIPWFII